MADTQYVRLVLRQDTEQNWQNTNPVLFVGEMGYNTTNNQFKVGDGITSWNNLDYYSFPIDYNNIKNKPSVGEGLITLNFNGNKLGHFNVNTPENQTIDVIGFRPTFPVYLDKQNNLTLLLSDKYFMRDKEDGKLTLNFEAIASALKAYM